MAKGTQKKARVGKRSRISPKRPHALQEEQTAKTEAVEKEAPKPSEQAETQPPAPYKSYTEPAIVPQEESTIQERRSKTLFLFGLFVLFGVIGVTFALVYAWTSAALTESNVVAVQKEEKPKMSFEKKPVFDKTAWTFEVLNGAGIAGAAKNAAKLLESAGFTVLFVGNAERSDYKTTTIFIAKDLLDQKGELLEALKDVFPNVEVSDETLEDSTASARLIVGKE